MTTEIKMKGEPLNKKEKSNHTKKEKKEGESKDIYFLILYSRKQQEKFEEFAFSENDKNFQNIYTNEIKKENGKFHYEKVFKFNGKTDKKYSPEFEIGKDNYIISFHVKESSFIYDVELKKGNKRLKNIAKEIIDQKSITYEEKLNIFLKSLKNNNEEEDKIEILYRDTINLFEKKKGFNFLISLFVQIYENKKLCPLLIKKFKDMNNNPKDNEKNMDRDKDLEKYIKKFEDISSKADNLIKNNDYDIQQYYAIILCYLNYYDYNSFIEIYKKLFKEKWDDLYEILLIYFSHFLNPIEQNVDFFIKFINYCAENKEFNIFENGLNYINDIETFITVIDETKKKIVDKYNVENKSFKPIKFKSSLELKKKENNKEILTIISKINSINNYCKDKKVLLIYFTSNFWKKILKAYNIPDQANIEYCYKLREIFFEYNLLINQLYNKDLKSEIKKDINKYFDQDEFAFILDKNIEKMLDKNNNNNDNNNNINDKNDNNDNNDNNINKNNNGNINKELNNSEILGFVEAFNPYYKEDKYLYKRGTYIFDYINLDEKYESENEKIAFIETFRKLKFEIMFKDNIIEFLDKMISKIKTISNFGTILELIDINKLSKVNEFFTKLKTKYEVVIKKEIDSLNDKELNKAIKIIAKFAQLIFNHEKNCNFIEQKISKLDKKISSLIYNELMRTCKGEEYKTMKELIYKKFLNKLENINNIIDLINSLEKQDKTDKKIFMEELMKKCQFTKEEYYSKNENEKINLLCELNDKEKIIITEDESYKEIEIIQQISHDLLDGEIPINKLEEFLENDEKQVIKRLKLITLIYKDFNPEKQYTTLKKDIGEIKNVIKELNSIKSSLLIFFRNKFQNEIRDISNLIRDMQEKDLKNYKAQKTKDTLTNLKVLNKYVENVEKVNGFLLFKVLYDEAYGKDQEKRFNVALNNLKEIKESLVKNTNASKIYEENKEIFNKIKEMLTNNEKANTFIEQMKTYFNLTEKNELINKLSLIFKSKMYEMDLKSIIYFFDNFNVENNNIEWKKIISSKYNKLSEMTLENLELNLKELKDNGIYDYEKTNKKYNLFTSLYEKKEAIDFLVKKKNTDISSLLKKIDPTNRTINIDNIKDTEKCIEIFNKLKELKDYSQIFEYINKELDEKDIEKIENFSKNYTSIIELDRNDDTSLNLYNKVNNYIQDATFIFRQDNEDFSYGKNETTTMEELIHVKNQIHIKPQNSITEDEFQKKCNKLIFFKELISNLEIIYEYMKILRTKGSSLPILINIKIQYDENDKIIYKLNKTKTKFEAIKDFLFLAKTDYISQLDLIYKQKKYLRFLFGKLFRNIIKHLDGGYNVSDILRFIINKTDNKEPIKDGRATNPKKAEDYVAQYKVYHENSFDNISNYLISLFNNNGTSLQNHYESMLMKEKNKYKGIYLYNCENISIDEFILYIYLDKMDNLPIAQNILICSKETSQEEMQAFFYRAILCDYNTLFVVEINDSFSDFQQNIMYTYIDTLLTYKNEKYKEYEKKNVDKIKTKEYLDSCIIFVYEKNNKENISFLNEIKRYEPEEMGFKYRKEEQENETNTSLSFFDNKVLEKIKKMNITIVTSDKCGLGKSYTIKKMIEKNKKYYHFPLGGILTKAVIFKKLSILLEKIKKENEKSDEVKINKEENEIRNENSCEVKNNNEENKSIYENIAIHLDLIESKETTTINEFLFSFLITKFYTNNENIIYIPKEIDIYIEIPNCFESYMSKFSILNVFDKVNISLKEMPKLDYTQDLINKLNEVIEFDSKDENKGDEIEKFIQKNIGTNKSYHQIIIFIKLFISQFSKCKSKLKIKEDNENIEKLSECIKYFTNGGFAELLMSGNNDDKEDEKKDYIDLLSFNYNNDLNKEFDKPLIFFDKEKKFIEFNIAKSKEYHSSEHYLKKIKELLELPNEVEKDVGDKKSLLSILNYKTDNYVITNDNFKKMLLLIYRIQANVPVIIMGETGCGKTALITKLNQILNNGEITVKIINIHPGITDVDICEYMKEINKEAEKNEKEIWAFFDEINTCLSLSLLTEIFINRTYNGDKLNDNIKLIGACNPYRKRKKATEKCGISRDDDNENELVYLVQPLPQSLLYYVFSFGSINEEDEKKYIYSIIEKLFKSDEQDEKVKEVEEKLHELTRDAIFECHKFLRETFDPSIVSLREISRFSKCVEFFKNYFAIKDEIKEDINNKENKGKLYKIKSIICSLYLCYYIRLIEEEKRGLFNFRLRNILLNLVNVGESENPENKKGEKGGDLLPQIKFKQLYDDLHQEPINQFSDFLKIEEDFLLDKIDLDKGIGINNLLRENTFLLFLAVITKIPLIIVGKPGTGKSLSAQLIYKSMRGIYSKNIFFKKFPQIIQTYFQGSESTQPEDVEKLFEIAGNKLQYYKKNGETSNLPISMILFDELGLSEKSETNPLKVLHSKLEYAGKEEGVSFIGISNYSLDAAKVNRALNLSVPNLEDKVDQLVSTSLSIVQSISEDLSKRNIIFDILARSYYEYKKYLYFIKELAALKQFCSKNEESKDLKKKQFSEIKDVDDFKKLLKKEKSIKVDFHGNRDLYNFIKGIAKEFRRLNENELEDERVVLIIENNIERNFGGIDYEIDIDLDLKLSDIEDKIKVVNEILKEPIREAKNKSKKKSKKDKNKENKERIKVTSVFLYKKIYNYTCDKENHKSYKIKENRMNVYNLNECINDNINDNNNRYLLLEIKPSLASLIYQNIRIQNPTKTSDFYEGSPFVDDINNEYKFKKVNEIQDDAKTDKLILLQNLNQIQPFLYDLYNMNYIIKDEQKFARICLDNFSEQLTPVNDLFRIIILVDKNFINEVDIAFLNRLEKMKINFDKLLDNNQIKLAETIINKINFKYNIDKYEKQIKYSLKDLLINCGKEEIEGLIYNLSIKNRNKNNEIDNNDFEEIIYNKISNILPQDIICILPDNNIIKKTYENKQYYNLKDYLTDKENNKFTISIIYTFNNIANIINGINNEMKFMVQEVRSENQLKNLIEEIKNENENKIEDNKNYNIILQFEQINSNKIQFISNFVIKNYKNDNKYKYIFIIHIKRNFDNIKERIYSIPNINPNIGQIFIDNLNGLDIKLNDLLDKNIKDIMDSYPQLMDLDKEFIRTLTSFINKELNENRNNISNYINENNLINADTYIEEIHKYMDEETNFKDKIIEKVKELINSDKNLDGDCKSVIDKILKENYIGKNSIDIISCLLDYIKENIFSKYLKHILIVLEDNNILTTLLEIKKNKNNKLEEKIIEQLRNQFLKTITFEPKHYKPKFKYYYKIPGFYNFYKNLSDYICKNIAIEYFNNEKKLREYYRSNNETIKIEFHKKEEYFLSTVYEAINEDKYIFSNIENIPADLMLNDYITYYLENYNKDIYQSDINNKVIELLLNLRFNEEKNEIIKKNKNAPTKLLLIKIMWIESNVNYILSILKLFYSGKKIFNDDDNQLYKKIKEIINNETRSIKYITKENRNPEHTREVNECYYIILASFCLCVTSEDIELTESTNDENKVEINQYYDILKELFKILEILNNDLYIYLNEMYIIDELKEIIELQRQKKINIVKIEEIRKYFGESALIIQENKSDKIDDLIVNFQNIYESLTSEEINKEENINYYNKYYDTLKHIFFKEINKIPDTNYRCIILGKILLEKEIIKKSNDILQILLKNYISVKAGEKEFKKNLSFISKADDEIINLIENNLVDSKGDNYFALSETLLYFFEKTSINYLKNALFDVKEPLLLEKEPLDIFKDCIKFLYELKEFPDKKKIKNISKLFCLGYIKTYCFTFIKMFDEPEPRFKDPELIIEVINENKLKKMIILYIYKILFNLNQIDVFFNQNKIKKYQLDKYKGFDDFKKSLEEEKINFGLETLDNDNYENIYKEIEKYKKDSYKGKIKIEENDLENLSIDNFYNASDNLILTHLKRSDFEKSIVYNNFYNNICKPLFENSENDKLSKAIQLFFNPKEYDKIKNENKINPTNIEAILYGYRYCLNELSEPCENGIYSTIYDKTKIGNLSDKYYPGSHTKNEPYYDLYCRIINHFKDKPSEGCYVCLCNKGFYHSVPSGFPGKYESNIFCPCCHKEIGAKCKDIDKKILIVKRNNYFRIFKNNDEIGESRKRKDSNNLKEINIMTLDDFKKQYITNLFIKDIGLPYIDENYFKKDNKVIRNLSQISYRLLNYILYSHLFFARIITNTSRYDNYLPKPMKWGETLNECWILLKNELLKKDVSSIDIFMNLIFKDLFNKLHDQECIKDYNDLIAFEKDLDQLINSKIEVVKQEIEKYKQFINEKTQDKTSSFYLLKETYSSQNNSKDDYPYYEYFYYCDYLDEKYISQKLSHLDRDKYPILNKYLEYQNNNKNNNDDYALDNLYLFNTTLNLFSEKYSHQITREYAEKKLLKDDEIYIKSENKKIIDKFMKFYNKLKICIQDSKEKKFIELKADKNHLCDFFLDDNNEIGKTYKDIYNKFIQKQNEEIEKLLMSKVFSGVFDLNCTKKINIQQIKEDEIFTFNAPEKFSFINVVFNSSYRKIIDNNIFEMYNQYEINFNSIEETMTDLLLKNKKSLNDNIIGFSYNDEVFNNEVNDLITSFKQHYISAKITLDDKEILYKFIKDNENNNTLYKNVINDFITLLQYLNDLKKEDNDNNNLEESKIYEINEKLKDILSKEFFEIFEAKNDLTVNKTSEIFEYYLKLIYTSVKAEIKDYQENLEENEIKNKKNKLDNYFQKESSLISKDDFENAIRLFITLVLFREEDKVKIKSNRKNIVNYLKAIDLWDKQKFEDEKFDENLNELNMIHIQINQILNIVDIKEEDTNEIKEHIKNKEVRPQPPVNNDTDTETDSDGGGSQSEDGRGGRDE